MEHVVAAYADEVMRAGQLAAALEVSSYPKPGNVHRMADWPHKRFEHFIAGSIALGPALRDAAIAGGSLGLHQLEGGELGLGRLIKKAVLDIKRWQKGGNTHLGVVILFIPMAVSAGSSFSRYGTVTPERLQDGAVEALKSSTIMDAVDVYEAIREVEPSGLGDLPIDSKVPSVMHPEYRKLIFERGLRLIDVMEEAAEWDDVAYEVSKGYKITFTIALPTFLKTYEATDDVNLATVQTFLTILASRPDTFIARNVGTSLSYRFPEAWRLGVVKAREVSKRAREVLDKGGVLTEEGRGELWSMDEELRRGGEAMNPGSTADITASCLFVALLCGLRF